MKVIVRYYGTHWSEAYINGKTSKMEAAFRLIEIKDMVAVKVITDPPIGEVTIYYEVKLTKQK